MRERGIIFNTEMVRAVLEGRKTQTRRIMKVQPESNQLGLLRITASTKRSDIGKYHWAESNATGNHVRSKLFACPYGAVGDRLWVRETWSEDFANYYPNDRVWYAADDDRRLDIEVVDGVRGIFSPESNVHVPFRWHPSILMPRWASRITLEITGVRVERLNSISEADAKAEGIKASKPWSGLDGCVGSGGTPAAERFESLWQSIYGVESWQANPWVWVVEFKRVEGVHVQTS
ncbi:hypothetical protein [Pantoea sp. CTOTU49201]|uniref:hypothetical protein n=1 Tax=Pantoea sp. CTOTU49201 TaxID=2953855 RepID=UPI00289FF333|nr:hypothetical protein [Pantoea sp. CTOTU49201]